MLLRKPWVKANLDKANRIKYELQLAARLAAGLTPTPHAVYYFGLPGDPEPCRDANAAYAKWRKLANRPAPPSREAETQSPAK